MPANTYAYKLAGPLYIRKELNIISNVSYTPYGEETEEVDENGKPLYNVGIEIFYEYNCPDTNFYLIEDENGITTKNGRGFTYREVVDDKYAYYEEYVQGNYYIGSNI
jgi:hypothetical protein